MTAKGYKCLGVVGGVCLVSAVVALVLLRPGLPSYEGKSVRFWFKRLPRVQVYSGGSPWYRAGYGSPRMPGTTLPGDKDAREALVAMRAMGTNALPFLMRKLRRSSPNTRFDKLVQRYGGNLPVIRELFPNPKQVSVEREQAVTGLLVLCPLPEDTMRELLKLAQDLKGPTWGLADDVLRANVEPSVVSLTLKPYGEF